ncbi:hypothetical protein [Actinomadura alba]|uniref:hypothetical protein n=1 Tax=Actinomadura alba TaxID=406431 RepID=UPI0028A5FD75|nr:hypothetical protein [Actinomadura alba]
MSDRQNTIDPSERHDGSIGCRLRWGNDHLNPNMQQEDPMCRQAWQDNPDAMWNWRDLSRTRG